jgi:hypothetical protein
MTLEQIENQLREYNDLYNTKQISKAELLDLVKGLDIVNSVAETAEDLERKEQLNTIITSVISAASMVA